MSQTTERKTLAFTLKFPQIVDGANFLIASAAALILFFLCVQQGQKSETVFLSTFCTFAQSLKMSFCVYEISIVGSHL